MAFVGEHKYDTKSMKKREVEELINVGKAMSKEQKRIILTTFPTEFLQQELMRRESVINERLGYIYDQMHNVKGYMTLNEKEEMEKDLKLTMKGMKDGRINQSVQNKREIQIIC